LTLTNCLPAPSALLDSCAKNADHAASLIDFAKTVIMNHPVHFKIFYTNDTELVDNLAALLVGEVLPFPGNPLMHTSDSLAVLAPLWGTLAKFGMLALDAGYGFLFSTKEARILDFLSIGEGCKGLQANVNAYGLTVFRQVFWLDFTRNNSHTICR